MNASYYSNAMLGGNPRDCLLIRISDDEGKPFTVVNNPVGKQLAVKSKTPAN